MYRGQEQADMLIHLDTKASSQNVLRSPPVCVKLLFAHQIHELIQHSYEPLWDGLVAVMKSKRRRDRKVQVSLKFQMGE